MVESGPAAAVSLEVEARSIARRVRRGALAWFVLITALLLGAGGLSFYRLRHTILVLTDQKVEAIGNNLVSQLKISDAIYRRMSLGGARVLEADYLALGSPVLVSGGQDLPDLRFGRQWLTDRPDLLEGVINKMGGTATVFAVKNGQFIRVLTNVRDGSGNLAVGTRLHPGGQAFAALKQGKRFMGVVEILGQLWVFLKTCAWPEGGRGRESAVRRLQDGSEIRRVELRCKGTVEPLNCFLQRVPTLLRFAQVWHVSRH